jgi:hypothetical protein
VPVIKDFAAQLAKRNLTLVFMPVPTKPMVCREGLGLAPGVSAPPAWTEAADDLAAAGIGFVDLLPLMQSRGPDAERYLKQDTHWTPATMEAAAREVAARIGHPTGSGAAPYRVESVEREHRGDLEKMLVRRVRDVDAVERPRGGLESLLRRFTMPDQVAAPTQQAGVAGEGDLVSLYDDSLSAGTGRRGDDADDGAVSGPVDRTGTERVWSNQGRLGNADQEGGTGVPAGGPPVGFGKAPFRSASRIPCACANSSSLAGCTAMSGSIPNCWIERPDGV